jgi:hypothetical protein
MAAEPRGPAREEFGGINWGSAFFGWLVAVAVAVLLTALLAAAGVAVALGEIDIEVDPEADELGIGGAIGLLVIAVIGYFAGGYVAGRMSRFNGAMQGLAVWIWAIVITVVLAILGWIADQEWNVLAQLDLPRIPADETVTGLGIASLIVILIATALAAMAGGRVGVGYHAKVDEAAYAPAPAEPRHREEAPPREREEPPPAERRDEPPPPER